MTTKILFIGDVFATAGIKILSRKVDGLRRELSADLVVANGENATQGMGISAASAQELFDLGLDLITTGNHVWRFRDLLPWLDEDNRLLRPANYPGNAPGRGYRILDTPSGQPLAVVNLEGRIFMKDLEDPMMVMDRLLSGPLKDVKMVCIDMHAEATSEKQALAWYLAGRVSSLVGTHTHVQTSDERILSGHTAYITDLGMTGPHDSVIGMDKKRAITRMRNQRPMGFKAAKGGARLQGALVEIESETGKAVAISRLDIT